MEEDCKENIFFLFKLINIEILRVIYLLIDIFNIYIFYILRETFALINSYPSFDSCEIKVNVSSKRKVN